VVAAGAFVQAAAMSAIAAHAIIEPRTWLRFRSIPYTSRRGR